MNLKKILEKWIGTDLPTYLPDKKMTYGAGYVDGFNSAKDILREELPSLIVALKEQAEQTKLTTDDMQQVGEHYWGGDYSPSSTELIKLTDAVNEMIISKHK